MVNKINREKVNKKYVSKVKIIGYVPTNIYFDQKNVSIMTHNIISKNYLPLKFRF